jgi:hypothetical protein
MKKYICSGYSKQSNICNCKYRGKCPTAFIETDIVFTTMSRCGRRPYIGNKEHYVEHIEIRTIT